MAEAEQNRVPRVLIAGTGLGVGVSTLVLGLLVHLRKQGLSVGTAKLGPGLVDTTHFRRISGRLASSLDFWLLNEHDITASMARLAGGAELLLFEGERGALDNSFEGSCFQRSADFAARYAIPIVLVVDARGYAEGIAALVRGFLDLTPPRLIAGVVANFVKDDAHNQKIQRAIGELGAAPYLGGLRVEELLQREANSPEHPGNPSLLTRSKILLLGEIVQRSIDVPAIMRSAHAGSQLEIDTTGLQGGERRCRIAVADDAAFHLSIQDNLDLMRRAGAEVVPFSPLADIKLPNKTCGIYLPSGYPHLYASDLQSNKQMITAIRDFAAAGGVIYAEGNASSYLARKLVRYSGDSYDMLGILPGTASALIDDAVTPEPVYCDVVAAKESLLCRSGDRFRGIRDTRFLIRLDEPVLSCFQLRDRTVGRESTPSMEGLSPLPHVFVTNVQGHWGSNPTIAKNFVDAVATALPSLQMKGLKV